MSSGSERERPTGIIVQGTKVVGSVCIPDATDEFIRQFNYCYGPMKMVCSRNPSDEEKDPRRRDERFRMPMWSREMWETKPSYYSQP